MGVIQQGILGAVSGRVGPVVGGSWKGIAYLRGYQGTVAQPNTALQVAQKQRMRIIVGIAKATLTQIIKPLNDRFAVHMSGYNLFVSRNIEFIDASGAPSWPDFIWSEGTLTGFDTLAFVSSNGSANVTASWVNNSGTGTALATDEFYGIALNTTSGDQGMISGVDTRADTSSVIVMSGNATTGDNIECYGAFRSANGFRVSNSLYYNEITP